MSAELFTQSRLQDYLDCPYRYWLRYVKRVESPSVQAEPVREFELAIDRGTTFHRLVQQYMLGVPASAIERHIQDDRVREWWFQFLREGLDRLPARRLPEITLVARLGETPIAAKLDLLTFEPGRVVIVDWKTSRRPTMSNLESRLQTKLYLWVVSQAVGGVVGSSVAPEDIQMRYWFAGEASPWIEISYSQDAMRSDERELKGIIQRIEHDTEFSRTDDLNICKVCVYRSISRPEQPAAEVLDVEDDQAYAIEELADRGE